MFTICGVRTFGFLMISLKLTELEGGYFFSELNGHPVCCSEKFSRKKLLYFANKHQMVINFGKTKILPVK